MSQKHWSSGKNSSVSGDQLLGKEVRALVSEVTDLKFKLRVLEAKIFLMESEHDMLVRMLRLPVPVYTDNQGHQMARPLDRLRFTRMDNLMDPLYNLVQPDGRINATLTVTRYGIEPEKSNCPEIPDNSNESPGPGDEWIPAGSGPDGKPGEP